MELFTSKKEISSQSSFETIYSPDYSEVNTFVDSSTLNYSYAPVFAFGSSGVSGSTFDTSVEQELDAKVSTKKEQRFEQVSEQSAEQGMSSGIDSTMLIIGGVVLVGGYLFVKGGL